MTFLTENFSYNYGHGSMVMAYRIPLLFLRNQKFRETAAVSKERTSRKLIPHLSQLSSGWASEAELCSRRRMSLLK